MILTYRLLLIAIKSIIELNYNDAEFLNNHIQLTNKYISKIKDVDLSKKIKNQLHLKNFGKTLLIIDDYLYDNYSMEKKFYSTIYNKLDIKQFTFDFFGGTNADIKILIDVKTLHLNRIFSSEYFRHWDNLNRVTIIINESIIQNVKSNKDITLFAYKSIKNGRLGYYTRIDIVKKLRTPKTNSYSGTSYQNNQDWYMDAYENDESNLWNTD
jgi:hypothetical protein